MPVQCMASRLSLNILNHAGGGTHLVYGDGRQLQSIELALQENWEFPVGTRHLAKATKATFTVSSSQKSQLRSRFSKRSFRAGLGGEGGRGAG